MLMNGTPTVEQTYTSVETNTHTRIALGATKLSLINRPDDSGTDTATSQLCIDNDSKELKLLRGHYTRTLCQQDCLMQRIYNECSCVLPIDPNLLKNASTPFCTQNVTELCVIGKVAPLLANTSDTEVVAFGCAFKNAFRAGFRMHRWLSSAVRGVAIGHTRERSAYAVGGIQQIKA